MLTGPFGGPGGIAGDDQAMAASGQITAITVGAGDGIDSLLFIYGNASGTKIGGSGGIITSVSLASNEFITQVCFLAEIKDAIRMLSYIVETFNNGTHFSRTIEFVVTFALRVHV